MESKSFLKQMRVNREVICPYLYFPIILNEEASAFVKYMNDKNISVRRYYTANHNLAFYKNRYRTQNLVYTEKIMDNIVALPLHTVMSDAETQYLFDTVSNYFQNI